jgi:hypothetical protein
MLLKSIALVRALNRMLFLPVTEYKLLFLLLLNEALIVTHPQKTGSSASFLHVHGGESELTNKLHVVPSNEHAFNAYLRSSGDCSLVSNFQNYSY